MLKLSTILHPTDFSPLSRHAFDVACALAQDYRARLVLLHVHEPPIPMGELVPTEPPEIQRLLLRDLQQLPAPPDVAVEHRLEVGPVAESVVTAAAETGCDLIVIGTHGRGGIGRVLLGSVAESVLRRASCMVLTVKAPTSPA